MMAGLEGTVKVPGFGDVPKKNVLIVGAVAGGIAGVAYIRKRQAGAAAAVPVDSGAGAVDQNAFGDTTPVGPGGSATLPDGSAVPPQIIQPQSPGISTNVDWIQAAGALDLGGVSGDVITQAMVKIIGGTPVTQAQLELWNEVTGIIGFPPQGYKPPKLVTGGTVPVPPATPAGMHMAWVTSPVAASAGQTIKYAQDLAARSASAKGVWHPSSASLKAVEHEAAARSNVNLTTKLRKGQQVTLFTAVKG